MIATTLLLEHTLVPTSSMQSIHDCRALRHMFDASGSSGSMGMLVCASGAATVLRHTHLFSVT